MKGRRMYFYALKEDFLDNIKELEGKFGGLQYIKALSYKKPEFEIYDSIEDLTDIGTIRQNTIHVVRGDPFMFRASLAAERPRLPCTIKKRQGTICSVGYGLYGRWCLP